MPTDVSSTNNTNSYFLEKSQNSLAPALGGNILKRTTSDKRGIFANGCTARSYVFGSVPTTTVKKMVVSDELRMPTDPENQRITLPQIDRLEGDAVIKVFAPTDVLYNGLLDGNLTTSVFDATPDTTYTITAEGEVPANSTTTFLKAHSAIEDGDSLLLPEGMKVGNKSILVGAPVNLGEFLVSDPTIFANTRGVYNGSGTGFGPTGVQRSLSKFVQATLDTSDTSGFGAPGGYNTDEEKVKIDFSFVNLRPSVTVYPPSTGDDATSVFTIKAGTRWFGDSILQDKATGKYLNLANGAFDETVMDYYVDVEAPGQPFIRDFVVDLAKYRITEPFTLTPNGTGDVLSIAPGTLLDLSFTVNADLDWGSTTPGSGSALDNIWTALKDGDFELYLPVGSRSGLTVVKLVAEDGTEVLRALPDGTDRDLPMFGVSVTLPTGTQYPSSLTLRDGMVFSKALTIPEGSTLSEVTDDVTASVLQPRKCVSASHVILAPRFAVDGDALIRQIIGTSTESEVAANSITTVPQSILPSSKWSVPAKFDEAVIATGHVAQSWIKILTDQVVDAEILLANDSLLKAGSVISPGFVTRNGMRSMRDSTFNQGENIASDLDLFDVPMELVNGVSNSNPLVEGTVIQAVGKTNDGLPLKTVLPSGFTFTNGNRLPGTVRIQPTENVTINADSILEAPVFGANFVLSSVHLESGWEFAPNTQLSAGVALGSGTFIARGNKFPFPFPLPAGHKFAAGTKLPVGLSFAAGATLPGITLRPQEDGLRDLVIAGTDVPYLTVLLNNKLYVVWRKNTVFDKGSILPKGFVLLAADGFKSHASTAQTGCSAWINTTTKATAFSSSVYTSGNWVAGSTGVYTFDQAEYGYDHSTDSASLGTLTLDAGVPLDNSINLRGEFRLPCDAAYVLLDNASILKKMTFAVDFPITKEVLLDSDLTVDAESSVHIPSDMVLPWDLTLSSELRIPQLVTLARRVVLPSNGISEFDEAVLAESGSFVKLPGHTTALKKKVRVAGSLVISSTGSKSYIELQRGTKINFGSSPNDGYKLKGPLELAGDWTVLEDIISSPSFVVAGMKLVSGSTLPGVVNIGHGMPFPDGLVTSTETVLAQDYTVTNKDNTLLRLPRGSFLQLGSVIGQDSEFENGCQMVNIEYGPVSFWNDGRKFYLYHQVKLPRGISYNFFSDIPPYSVVVDNSSEITEIANILGLIKTHLGM